VSHKQIKLRIFPDGQVQADVVGFQGKKCADYISILEEMLDAEAIDSERTAEYFLQDTEVVTDQSIPQLRVSGSIAK